jgi:hypothetical protein
MESNLIFKGIDLNLDWTHETDVPIDKLPKCAGVYAQIHWPSNGVRIGHAANLRGRHQEARAWFNRMHNGTAPTNQIKRNNVFCQAAKRDGHAGFGHCIISIDSRLSDKVLREEVESFLFHFVATSERYLDFNYQRGYRNTLHIQTIDEAVALNQLRKK